ncbi:hypothetical protein OROHE_026592 [Orobanche hederae]
MESFDSSPNYMKATSSFDAKIEHSPRRGSECHDMISTTSSTCGSLVTRPCARKLNNIGGIKHGTNKNRTMKNFENAKSFRRRAKSRIIHHSPVTIFSEDSLLGSSDSSPHYLKSTSSSQGKKMVSPGHNKSLQALSRTFSLRNVKILIKKTSFKPKRSLLNYSEVSEDVTVTRGTYSSTLKNSNFSKPVELHSGGAKSEKNPHVKICRYHHCSLHGHCQGSHDPVSQAKPFLYRRRRSLNKQKSIIPKIDSGPGGRKRSSDKKKSQIIPVVEPLNSYEEICPKPEVELFGDGYENIRQLDFIELAFGEMSFPERSYKENIDISRKYSLFEQELCGGRSFGPSGYCLRFSCHEREQVTSEPGRADGDLSLTEVIFSSLDGNEVVIEKPNEQVGDYIEDVAILSRANENSDRKCPEGPVIYEVIKKKSELSSSINSRSSSDIYYEEEREFTTQADDFKVDNKVAQINESEKYSPTQEVSKLQFSKKKHISMWHLIHEHMSMDLVAERQNEPLEGTNDESPMEDENSEMDTMSIDSESREIELRKMFAIKLVREAIEKILLTEVQDQASDDQSVTSESTPRTKIFERNLTREFNQAEPDIDQEDGTLSYIPKDERLINDYTSSQEIMQKEKDVVRKSEKKAPKHWSNLKKWILLQRFIRELEKVKKFNPKKLQLLPLVPDPEAEKVNLRSRTVDGRKSAEEWMLDYAIRQAVSQLAPTQKRKVALLVKAFETVAPTLVQKKEDDPQVQYRIPRLESHGKNKGAENQESGIVTNKKIEKLCRLNDDPSERIGEVTSTERFACKDLKGIQKDSNIGLRSVYSDGAFIPSNGNTMLEDPDSKKDAVKLETIAADEIEIEATPKLQDFQENALCDPIKENGPCTQMDKNNHIKMWHMIYQHVVSGIADKVGSRLLDGAENDEVEDNFSPDGGYPDDFSQSTNCSSGKNHVSNGFTKSDALKLVKEAVDEILLPEIQDDSSDTQPVTSESVSDIDIKSEVPKAKNWSKLKRLILLKRSIKALEKARKVEPKPNHLYSQAADHVPEKIELRRQMMGEKKKAEEWMLDYAVRHIVTKLTPARKRRVSMLVEAFEAVVPLPDM